MKIVTWNVNGVRACMGHGLLDYLTAVNADIVALQETKTNEPLSELTLPGYATAWNAGERLGYSGTACLFKQKPLSVRNGADDDRLDKEGRLITLEYPAFYFVNTYVPNTQGSLERWYYRLDWDAAFLDYLYSLQVEKPIIVAGDFNVARDYIDIFPENLRNIKDPSGFRSEERDGFNSLLDIGLIDVFRELHPGVERAYSWWSNRLNKRSENRGWRIDYFLVSKSLLKKVKSCEIRADISGSDHAPVEMVVKL
jgi:exodeoxyribonuclease-3